MDAGEEAFDLEDEELLATDELDSDSDDSEKDPGYEPLEEARSRLSRLSLNRSSPREAESEIQAETGIAVFERIEKMIKDGKIDKLKVDECKDYLRRHALRRSGNKNSLLARIKEHQEILGGGGLSKYPVSSFTLNCKGDACKGDIVMFRQEGAVSRTVAGRIVKESYGTEKQQHTFTIEVLWSKGKKPLPSLYPLLIKGRNLYKLKTMRQAWPDEGERSKVLDEKHSRGNAARCSRETRIREKEMRKNMGARRCVSNSQELTNNVSNNVQRNEEVPQEVRATGCFPQIPIQPPTRHEITRLPDMRENNAPVRGSNVHELTRMPRHQMAIQSRANRYPEHLFGPEPCFRRPLRMLNPSSSSSMLDHAPRNSNPLDARGDPTQRSTCVYHLQGKCGCGEACRDIHMGRDIGRAPNAPSSSSSSSMVDHGPGMNTHAPRYMIPLDARGDPKRKSICVYHLQKRCWYGEACRDIHLERDTGSVHPRYR